MKVDNSFLNQQVSFDGYKIYVRARNSFNVGLSLCVNENIPCRELTAEQIDSNFENIFLKVTIRTRKWLIISLHKPPNQKEEFLKKILVIFSIITFLYINILSFLEILI